MGLTRSGTQKTRVIALRTKGDHLPKVDQAKCTDYIRFVRKRSGSAKIKGRFENPHCLADHCHLDLTRLIGWRRLKE